MSEKAIALARLLKVASGAMMPQSGAQQPSGGYHGSDEGLTEGTTSPEYGAWGALPMPEAGGAQYKTGRSFMSAIQDLIGHDFNQRSGGAAGNSLSPQAAEALNAYYNSGALQQRKGTK